VSQKRGFQLKWIFFVVVVLLGAGFTSITQKRIRGGFLNMNERSDYPQTEISRSVLSAELIQLVLDRKNGVFTIAEPFADETDEGQMMPWWAALRKRKFKRQTNRPAKQKRLEKVWS